MIRPGERVGLIGRIGSGKTTIEKLVLGLYEPDQGAVLVDGTDLRQIDPADLRRNIGCVLQDVFLFHGTVRDNITLGAPFADDQAVLRAAQVAGRRGLRRAPSARASTSTSASAARACPAASARRSRSPARCCSSRRSWCSTSRPARWTTAPRTGSSSGSREILGGKTLLLVTHRASVLSLVERLIVLDGGKVVADGAKDEVLKALAAGRIRAQT